MASRLGDGNVLTFFTVYEQGSRGTLFFSIGLLPNVVQIQAHILPILRPNYFFLQRRGIFVKIIYLLKAAISSGLNSEQKNYEKADPIQ